MANKDLLPRYTMRISPALLKKLHYVSRYDGRTVNKELEFLIRRYINEFESQHGKIDFQSADEE